jgi:imidazolonepropionase-like amidohydrolase
MTFPRNRFVGFFLLVAAVSVLPCRLALGQGQAVDAQSTIAFIGVNVIPLTDGNTVLADQTVVVRNGSIVAIGPRARVAVPANATQIAAAVKYLMPGLADMHVHLEHFDNPVYLQLFLANGITSVRSMDGIPEILEAKRNAAAGTLLSPAIYTAGPVLDGDPPTRPEIRSVRNPDEARSAVLEQASAGYDFIKIYPNLSAESFRAIIRTAKERGLRVAGHLPRAVPLNEILAAGMASIEHVGDYADAIQAGEPPPRGRPVPGRRRLEFQADSVKMERLASQLARSGTWVVPTIVQADRAVASDTVLKRWMSDPSVAVIDRGILKYFWEAGVTRNAQALDANGWKLVEEGRRNRLALVAALRRAGVPMLVGTDTPQPFVFPGASVHEELENFVAAGFTPQQALTAATRDAARFIGQERLWGTVENGKRGDLLLLEANPLQDISATRRIAGVVTQGKWHPAGRLREMISAVERLAAASQ